jgi:hypothetical protein
MASAPQACVSWSCLCISCGWLRPLQPFGRQGLRTEGAASLRSAVPLEVVVGRETCSQPRTALGPPEVALLLRHRHLFRKGPARIFGGWLQSPQPTAWLQPTATTVNRIVGVLRCAVPDTSERSGPERSVPVGCAQRRAVYFNTCYTDRARKTSDHFSVGQVEAFCPISRCQAASRGSGRSRRLGALHVFDLRRGNEPRTRASGCCDHRGHSDQVGVRAQATGSLEQRRGVRTTLANAWPSMRSTSWAS